MFPELTLVVSWLPQSKSGIGLYLKSLFPMAIFRVYYACRPPTASPLQVPASWCEAVQDAAASFSRVLTQSQQRASDLVGIYLRGSLPQGDAVAGLSDCDLFAFLLCDEQDSPAILDAICARSSSLRTDLAARYPFCTKFGAPPWPHAPL